MAKGGNEWTKFVTDFYRKKKASNPAYKFKNALKDAKKEYKGGEGHKPQAGGMSEGDKPPQAGGMSEGDKPPQTGGMSEGDKPPQAGGMSDGDKPQAGGKRRRKSHKKRSQKKRSQKRKSQRRKSRRYNKK
jgi:hypothetical protein